MLLNYYIKLYFRSRNNKRNIKNFCQKAIADNTDIIFISFKGYENNLIKVTMHSLITSINFNK